MTSGARLAISTSWNAYRFADGAKLLFEINQLGFKAIELSFNLTANLVDSVAKEAHRLGISIQSLHNYCPIPDGLTPKQALPDCYSLAALDSRERSLAVKYTKSTIDTASRLGARVVVLHCGRVQAPDFTRQLINLYNQGFKDQADFTKLKEEMIRQRKRLAADFFEQALNSLDELNAYAKIKGVFLGVETRFYHCEIPDISEIGIILEKFCNSQIYYWHDTGHAQLMENLGFTRHKDFLELYGDRLIGVHLHDILGCQDHLAPLKGDLDFNLLKPYLKPNTIKVIEAHFPATAEDLIKSRVFISKIYDELN
ncbi:MAG: sugar phosphate isomerase/epimerase [Candidatus Omnitrophica bacterium]|nr:sugar phosphate isomerase/epimerase [Candidatus Omnitrophota bacterium]